MCDFRNITGIINLSNGEKQEINLKTIKHYGSIMEITTPKQGLYHIGNSGCGYMYYTGKYWGKENIDYEVIYDGYIPILSDIRDIESN